MGISLRALSVYVLALLLGVSTYALHAGAASTQCGADPKAGRNIDQKVTINSDGTKCVTDVPEFTQDAFNNSRVALEKAKGELTVAIANVKGLTAAHAAAAAAVPALTTDPGYAAAVSKRENLAGQLRQAQAIQTVKQNAVDEATKEYERRRTHVGYIEYIDPKNPKTDPKCGKAAGGEFKECTQNDIPQYPISLATTPVTTEPSLPSTTGQAGTGLSNAYSGCTGDVGNCGTVTAGQVKVINPDGSVGYLPSDKIVNTAEGPRTIGSLYMKDDKYLVPDPSPPVDTKFPEAYKALDLAKIQMGPPTNDPGLDSAEGVPVDKNGNSLPPVSPWGNGSTFNTVEIHAGAGPLIGAPSFDGTDTNGASNGAGGSGNGKGGSGGSGGGGGSSIGDATAGQIAEFVGQLAGLIGSIFSGQNGFGGGGSSGGGNNGGGGNFAGGVTGPVTNGVGSAQQQVPRYIPLATAANISPLGLGQQSSPTKNLALDAQVKQIIGGLLGNSFAAPSTPVQLASNQPAPSAQTETNTISNISEAQVAMNTTQPTPAPGEPTKPTPPKNTPTPSEADSAKTVEDLANAANPGQKQPALPEPITTNTSTLPPGTEFENPQKPGGAPQLPGGNGAVPSAPAKFDNPTKINLAAENDATKSEPLGKQISDGAGKLAEAAKHIACEFLPIPCSAQAAGAPSAQDLKDRAFTAGIPRPAITQAIQKPGVDQNYIGRYWTNAELAAHTGPVYATTGSTFNDVMCANGQPCPTSPGIAHPTAPLGTMVRVCDTVSGTCANLPVVDRGPSIIGRTIDLNPAAQARLSIPPGPQLRPVTYQFVNPDGSTGAMAMGNPQLRGSPAAPSQVPLGEARLASQADNRVNVQRIDVPSASGGFAGTSLGYCIQNTNCNGISRDQYFNLLNQPSLGGTAPAGALRDVATTQNFPEERAFKDPRSPEATAYFDKQLANVKPNLPGGRAVIDMDNPDAVGADYAKAALDRMDAFNSRGTGVTVEPWAKNPISITDSGGTSLGADARIKGAIAEAGSGSPAEYDAYRKEIGRPDMPVLFVGTPEHIAQMKAEIEAGGYTNMGTSQSTCAVGGCGYADVTGTTPFTGTPAADGGSCPAGSTCAYDKQTNTAWQADNSPAGKQAIVEQVTLERCVQAGTCSTDARFAEVKVQTEPGSTDPQRRAVSGSIGSNAFVRNPDVAPQTPSRAAEAAAYTRAGIDFQDVSDKYSNYHSRDAAGGSVDAAVVHGDLLNAGQLLDHCTQTSVCYNKVIGDGTYSKVLGEETVPGRLYVLGWAADSAPSHAFNMSTHSDSVNLPGMDSNKEGAVYNAPPALYDTAKKLVGTWVDDFGWKVGTHGGASDFSKGGRNSCEGGCNVRDMIYNGDFGAPRASYVVTDAAGTTYPGLNLPEGAIGEDGSARIVVGPDGKPVIDSRGLAVVPGQLQPATVTPDGRVVYADDRPVPPTPRNGNGGNGGGGTNGPDVNGTQGRDPNGTTGTPQPQPQAPAQAAPQSPAAAPAQAAATVPPINFNTQLKPIIACTPGAVLSSTTTPVNVSWTCFQGVARSTDFVTNDRAQGSTKVVFNSASSSAIRTIAMQCVQGTFTSLPATCSVRTIKPVVALTASPAQVYSGNAATLQWAGSDVDRCNIYAPGPTLVAQGGARGSTKTPKLQRSVIMRALCHSAAGVNVNYALTVQVVGDTQAPLDTPLPSDPFSIPLPSSGSGPVIPSNNPSGTPAATPASVETPCDPELPTNQFIACLNAKM